MHLDIGSEASVADPAGYFAEALQGGSVQWSDAQRGWVVLSHAEVERAFRDGETLSADRIGPLQRVAATRSPAFSKVVDLLSGWMNFRDPPVHTRLREPVKAAFTPRAVQRLETEVRQVVDEAIGGLPAGEVVDLSQAVAKPIPALVIGAMLGVDRADRPRLQQWSDDLSDIVFAISPGAAPEEQVSHAAAEFSAYFSRLVDRERAEPSGSVLSALVQGAGDLTQTELVGACSLLLFGGHETTTTFLINAIGTLLVRPDLLEWMRAHPAGDGAAIEEFMRIGGPARSMVRKVRSDHDRGGRELRAGQNVFICIASANHDPAVFADPGAIDLARDPNPHMGFGWGLHYCLGANLARLEAQATLRALLDRFPRIEPVGAVPPAHASALGFGRRPLTVRLGR